MADVEVRVRAQLFDQQPALLDDPHTWRAASCGRQAGKNFTAARLLVLTALRRDGASCAYVNATYGEARRIMWGDPVDGMPAVISELGLASACRLNESRLEVSLRQPAASVPETN